MPRLIDHKNLQMALPGYVTPKHLDPLNHGVFFFIVI